MAKKSAEQIWMELSKAESREDVLLALCSSWKNLAYYIYRLGDRRYEKMEIVKKSGKLRDIASPVRGLKYIQRNLSAALSYGYRQKGCVHGFVPQRSILTNARVHVNRRYVINLDLKDFFPSIHFGRVVGMFAGPPFGFNHEVAVTLAQICCFERVLPQGAPSSPVISNIVCRKLDNELLDLAKECRLNYSRYADDITFSTNLCEIPERLGRVEGDRFIISDGVRRIIADNGFELNDEKVRWSSEYYRQDVTGLVVNEKVNVPRTYIRRIRSMLHAWQKFGLQAAAKEHYSRFSFKKTNNCEESYRRRVTGMIGYVGMVKGRDSKVYLSLVSKLYDLDKGMSLAVPDLKDKTGMVVYCEGKTDPIHLKAALSAFRKRGLYHELDVCFHMYKPDKSISNSTLYEIYAKRDVVKEGNQIEVYLLDSDDKRYTDKARADGMCYTKGGQNIYLAVLPKPEHRNFDTVCIEHFYTDDDLKRCDKNNRRIYLSGEFDKNTGLHLVEPGLRTTRLSPLAKSDYAIISEGVLDCHDANHALSKNEFARAVSCRAASHKDVDFSHFSVIFDMLMDIQKDAL